MRSQVLAGQNLGVPGPLQFPTVSTSPGLPCNMGLAFLRVSSGRQESPKQEPQSLL